MTKTPAENDPYQHVQGAAHSAHCFVVMPFGRDSTEQKWFKGWYEVVIKPAVTEAGFDPKLSAAEEQPGAINDEIRSHLALDPMVVVDLGGAEPEDDPNPNVMYELGIRHALGLPLVILAWKGQRLPFDVSNQRIIMEDRDLVDLDTNRKRLISFIHAAQQGKYYRPMDAVGRLATIQAASESLGEDSLLRALAQEIKDLRVSVVASGATHAEGQRRRSATLVKHLVRGKVFRKDLYPYLSERGYGNEIWSRILNLHLEPAETDLMHNWSAAEWQAYVLKQAMQIYSAGKVGEGEQADGLDPELVEAIKEMLPSQPWPKGVAQEVGDKLGLTHSQMARYVRALIKRGDFMEQVDGELFPYGSRPT